MILGVDFDNTIVCYDALFHRVAVERGLVPSNIAANKNAVRDHLRAAGREPEWTALQGYVYGARMSEAEAFPGVHAFFRACHAHGITVYIIGHKTRYPSIGEAYDLHAAAQDWLVGQHFLCPEGDGFRPDQIFFELTKPEKLARIAACGCTHFIDGLPEILSDPHFPAATAKLLFAPGAPGTRPSGSSVFRSWTELQSHLIEHPTSVPAPTPSGLAPSKLGPLLARFYGEPPLTLEPLTSGSKNRVHRARTPSGHDYIVKQYYAAANDTRDRFRSEHSFYTFAWDVAQVRCIPEPLAWDEASHLGAFAFIDGNHPEHATADDVNAALDFFTQLNHARTRADALRPAAETCHTLAEHLATVQSRMDRLANIDGTEPFGAEARAFVRDELLPAWQNALHHPALVSALADESDSVPLPRCVSPSDLGFHNTLRRTDGSLVFFDFEYAGWDDPAKLVCDFFCQPAVPAPVECYDNFIAGVAAAIGCASPAVLAARCRLLLPIYQLKWCTIMLNGFLPAGAQAGKVVCNAEPIRKARLLLGGVPTLVF